jgi:hypothetical protein
MSLSAHLTAGTAEHGRLVFHPDCPRCRAERLAGSLGDDSLVSRRGQAALAAGLLAFSAAPPALAQVPDVDTGQETTPVPGDGPPGLAPEFDTGDDDTFDYETAPLPGGPEAGGEQDEGLGAPVETEAPTDLEADAPQPLPPEPEPVPAPEPPPEALPAPAPAPAPAPQPEPAPPGPTPAPPPAKPPAAEVERPAAQREPRDTPVKGKTPERAKPHELERRLVVGPGPTPPGTGPTPPPQSPAPVLQPPEAPAPPTAAPVSPSPPAATVPVSQPSERHGGPISGATYTVRAGDTLWSIARRLLGAEASAGQIAREVNRLWQLNQDRIGTGNPGLIRVGTVLKL